MVSMKPIDVDAAAERLEELAEALRSGEVAEIILTKGGVPAARLLPVLEQSRPGEKPPA